MLRAKPGATAIGGRVMEQWRPVPIVEYESLYEVSDQGRVRSLRSGNVLAPCPGSIRSPYLSVALWKNGQRQQARIHFLVCAAFHGERPPLHEVNHRDFDKLNNRAENLEWVTSTQNTKHAVDGGHLKALQGEQHPRARLTAADVMAIRARGAERLADLAAEFGVAKRTIECVRYGVSWKHLLIGGVS